MKLKVSIVVAIGLLLLIVGCSAKQNEPELKMYQAGLASKNIAESAYMSLRIAYKEDKIPQELWDEVVKAYKAWQIAQNNYVDALEEHAENPGSEVELALRRALRTLTDLASHFGGI